MQQSDFDEFAQALDDTYDLIGVGAAKVISPGAKAMFFSDLMRFPLDYVLAGLAAHRVDGERGKFTPKPADVIFQIDRHRQRDSRPDGEEAWAIALTSEDERNTVVWTEECAQAFYIAKPVLVSSGAISARKAFLAAYERLVNESRAARRPVKWVTSLGDDKAHQAVVLKAAVAKGLLPAPTVALLLPPPMPTEAELTPVARQQLAAIKRLLADGVVDRDARRDAAVAAEFEQDQQYRRELQQKVAAFEQRQP